MKKKPEVTPELIEACRKYKKNGDELEAREIVENTLYKEQRASEKIIQKFIRKSLPKSRGVTLKAGEFKIRASSSGYVRKVS